MKVSIHPCANEEDFWRVRNFLREIFPLNNRLEHSWNVARLDYWRWHMIQTCNMLVSVEKGMALWENADGRIVAALNHNGGSELRLHVHPQFRTAELEHEMLAYAEENYFATTDDGRRYVYLPIFEDDTQRQELVQSRGYKKQPGWGHHYRRDLDSPIADAPLPSGYLIRSMGLADDYHVVGVELPKLRSSARWGSRTTTPRGVGARGAPSTTTNPTRTTTAIMRGSRTCNPRRSIAATWTW